MNTSGFYNSNGDYAPNYVYSKDFELKKEFKDNYEYPIDGWSWYDSVEEAQMSENFDVSIINEINGEIDV